MASPAKLSGLRVLAARSLSAQAAPAAASRSAPPKIATTVLPNKLAVAAYDNGSPLARVTVAYKAGSRYEPNNEPGLTHHLRVAAGNTTSGASTFAITKNLQFYGANLTATVDRELIYYTLECTKNHLEDAVRFLNDVASRQTFRPWEIQDMLPRMRYEIAGLSPQVRTIDLLHRAAFRRGLGNSLFSPPRRIGQVSPESLQHYVSANFAANRCAVSAVGVSLDRAVAAAQTLSLEQRDKQDAASPYKGGELRKEMGGDMAYVALATEGTGLNSKDVLAFAVLSRALGNGPAVKYGNDNSVLGKAVAQELGGAAFAVNAFSASYTDAGLFGAVVTASSDNIGKATQAVARAMKSGSVGGDAIKRAKAQLQCEILSAAETPSQLATNLAVQHLLTGSVTSPAEVAESVGKISDADISNAASKISRGKISMGAAGALTNVPYVDELQ